VRVGPVAGIPGMGIEANQTKNEAPDAVIVTGFEYAGRLETRHVVTVEIDTGILSGAAVTTVNAWLLVHIPEVPDTV
jgi:hypothetical protein